ncbi:type VI secretion system-associated protein TagF [Pseudooceanicola sp. C21-150M6]|uniref:type VI secretion system-associated protein TagF n=1 Tax=Pseudooceanicola sp. C21-150M6 TaxID=3434355 RepID=UPI003D7F27DC
MATFGIFGKISGMGDFLKRGLTPEFCSHWDSWLQDRLPAAQDRLGARWRALYFSAPIWRFHLPAGLIGPAPVMGVIMPSVDRVGREFPLTLAGPAQGQGLATHLAADPVFRQLEDAALETLEDGASLDQLEARLKDLAPGDPPVISGGSDAVLVRGSGALLPVLAVGRGGGDQEAALWSSQIDGEARLMKTAGLPDLAGFAALFDPLADIWTGSVA